jgi:hypothetical protein
MENPIGLNGALLPEFLMLRPCSQPKSAPIGKQSALNHLSWLVEHLALGLPPRL